MTTRAAIEFRLGLVPLKRRHRHGQGRTYTDPRTVAAETAVGLAGRRAMGGRPPAAGEVQLVVIHDHEGGPLPDLDNVVKAVADGLNKIAWVDDRQVSRIIAERRQVARGAGGVLVRVSWEVSS